MQLRTFREKILYISSKTRKKDVGQIGYGKFDSLRTVGMFLKEKQGLSSQDRTYGDKHGNQITMLTIKYLIAIYMFSLKKNPILFAKELGELKKFELFSTIHLEKITDEEVQKFEEFQYMNKLQEVLQMKQSELLKKIPKNTFYSQEINSPVLLYLLYFLVSYGSSDTLLKDFDKIASKFEETMYNKSRFIFQTSVELYRDDMLLTMLLEPLADDLTPVRLIKIYNRHLDYYNNLLDKDEGLLSSSVSGYDSIGTNSKVRNNLSDKVKLFPDEKAYHDVALPEEILNLDEKSKKKILRVIIDLFNLESSYESLLEAIKMDYPHDISLLKPLYKNLEDRDPKIKTFDFNFTNLTTFRLIQEACSLSTKTHLVFNQRIIDILHSLENFLPDNSHPFTYLTRKTD